MRTLKNLVATLSIFAVYATHTTQVNSQLINPQIGENLWGMNYRQSITQDDILNTVTLCCNCDFFITQDDIDANGGGFTINQPGNWCLAQDIITSQPITISGMSNISFDLKGRSINSTTNGQTVSAIIDVVNSPGTLIKNGTIIGLDLGAGVVPLQRAGIGLSGSADSIIDGVHVAFFASTDNQAVFKSNSAFYINQDNTQCTNCSATGPFLNGFFINGDNNTFKNCSVSHFNGSHSGPFTVTGVGYLIVGSNNFLENCTSMGGTAQPTPSSAGSVGFYFDAGSNNITYNCIALNHQLSAFAPLGIPGGSGFYVTGNDCEIRNSISAYNALYGIFNTGTGLVVCNNSVHNNGTDLFCTPDSNLCSLVLASSGCDFMITQADIGGGGIYTITQPGKYCLAETVTYTASPAINIASNDVVLDLHQFPMIRTNTNPSFNGGAVQCSGTNCIIENGDIDSDTMLLTNTGITVRNCSMHGRSGTFVGIGITNGADNCSVINCQILGGSTGVNGITTTANGTLIDSCVVSGAGNGILLDGDGFGGGFGRVVQNCILNNNAGAGLRTTSLNRGAQIENCSAEGNGFYGFQVDGASNIAFFVDTAINNCKARFNGAAGIIVGTTNSLQAIYNGVGTYVINVDYGIRVTNNIAQRNPSNLIMILTINTDGVQPTIPNTSRIISPQVGIITNFVGTLVWDTTVGSTDFNVPVVPAFGSNISL